MAVAKCEWGHCDVPLVIDLVWVGDGEAEEGGGPGCADVQAAEANHRVESMPTLRSIQQLEVDRCPLAHDQRDMTAAKCE